MLVALDDVGRRVAVWPDALVEQHPFHCQYCGKGVVLREYKTRSSQFLHQRNVPCPHASRNVRALVDRKIALASAVSEGGVNLRLCWSFNGLELERTLRLHHPLVELEYRIDLPTGVQILDVAVSDGTDVRYALHIDDGGCLLPEMAALARRDITTLLLPLEPEHEPRDSKGFIELHNVYTPTGEGTVDVKQQFCLGTTALARFGPTREQFADFLLAAVAKRYFEVGVEEYRWEERPEYFRSYKSLQAWYGRLCAAHLRALERTEQVSLFPREIFNAAGGMASQVAAGQASGPYREVLQERIARIHKELAAEAIDVRQHRPQRQTSLAKYLVLE